MKFAGIMWVLWMGLTLSFNASADSQKYETKVVRIVFDDTRYAGCMAEVVPNLSLSGCNVRFVTFDCTGQLGTASKVSSGMLSGAQLALVTGNKILLNVVNNKTANGVCLATRLDNYNTP